MCHPIRIFHLAPVLYQEAYPSTEVIHTLCTRTVLIFDWLRRHILKLKFLTFSMKVHHLKHIFEELVKFYFHGTDCQKEHGEFS